MPIVAPEIISERGKADARRHRAKQKEAIKKQLPHIIAKESIITGKKGKVIKIPIKNLQIPEFVHKRSGKGGGIGQGKGGKGDVIGRRPIPGGKNPDGKPGEEPGVDYIETEVEIEELIELMLEDLGLPRLEEKDVRKIVVDAGWKVHGTTYTGPQVLRNTRKTALEGVRRFWFILEALHEESGRDKCACYQALAKAGGIFSDAMELLKDPSFSAPDGMTEDDISPFPIIHPEDERYHRLERKVTHKSQAVILAMMDVSGSMTPEKKYFARSLLWWLTEFLRRIYEHVEIRFIIHHTEAKVVAEEDFFRTGESGGTFCYSAYELANAIIESDYPHSQWNIYAWHFSDGEDFSPERAVMELKRLFDKRINMFGYGEIQPEGRGSSYAVLLAAFEKAFSLEEDVDKGMKIFTSENDQHPLLAVVIEKKEHILAALTAFLKRDRWKK